MPASDVPAPRGPQPEIVLALGEIPERRGSFAFFSNIVQKGSWTLPTNYRVFSAFGNVELDLASVRLGPASHIEIMAIMGNVEIRVPPGIRIECEVEPFMGNFEVKGNVLSTSSPDAPYVRITGSAYMSSIEVKVVDPNAPGVLDRLYAKWASRGSSDPNAG
jgi:hypothetical protein